MTSLSDMFYPENWPLAVRMSHIQVACNTIQNHPAPNEAVYLITLIVGKDKYFSAYGLSTQFNMYQPEQTIKTFPHVGGWIIEIVPEGGT